MMSTIHEEHALHPWPNNKTPFYKVTQHYLGIEQDERDEIYMNLEL